MKHPDPRNDCAELSEIGNYRLEVETIMPNGGVPIVCEMQINSAKLQDEVPQQE